MNRPIPFTIPFDVWALILRYADFATLQTFSIASRDLKHEADKYLWRACSLHAPARPLDDEFWTRNHIEEGCSTLLRDERASRLHDLTIDIQASLGVDGDSEFERVLKLMMSVLMSARMLRSLTVKSLHHRVRLACSLSAPYSAGATAPATSSPSPCSSTSLLLGAGFPFRLERFATDLFCDDLLYGFWSEQSKSLKHIELLSVDYMRSGQTPSVPQALPALNTLHVNQARQTSILRSSPIRTLDLAGIWEGECTIVKDNVCTIEPATLDLLLSETAFILPPTSFSNNRPTQSVKSSPSFPPGGSPFWRNNASPGLPQSSPPYGPALRSRSRSRARRELVRNTLLSRSLSTGTLSLGPGILDLRLTIFDDPVTAHAYTDLIAFLPHLRFLRLTHADMRDVLQRRLAMEVLAGLEDLEVFEWAGGGGSSAAQADVFAVASKQCRFLREITFRWGNGNYFERKFERESEEAPWGIVQSC